MKLTQEEIDGFIKVLKKAYVDAIKEGEGNIAVLRYELMYWVRDYDATKATSEDQQQTQAATEKVFANTPRVLTDEPSV